MAAFLLRLLTLVAVVMMPAGMASAAAAAHPAATASQASHCSGDEEQGKAPINDMDAQCMVCAGLPAGQVPVPERILPSAPRLIALATEIQGIILEIATPPPKLA